MADAPAERPGASGDAYAVRRYDGLDAVPDDVLRRIAYPAQGEFFLSWQWFRCLAAHGLPADLEPRVYVANDVRGAPACFLFCATRGRGRTLFGLSGFYTLEFAATFADGRVSDPRLFNHLARHVATERPRWNRVLLRFLRADRLTTEFLASAFGAEGFVVNRFFQYENWHCVTEDTRFEDYYQRRPSRLRNTIERKERTLRSAHDVTIEIHGEASAELIARWEAIYAASWKASETFPAFMPNFIKLCGDLGLLRLGVLAVDGRPAAAQLWIVSGRRATIYKLAHDGTYAKWSVGSILTRDMMRHAIERDGVIEVDYGVGSEPYKRDWMTASRDVIGLEAFNRASPAGSCLALKWRLFEAAKASLRALHMYPARAA